MNVDSKSDVGKLRQSNQDAYLNRIYEDMVLMVVADGLGGHKGGEVASQMAVSTIAEYIGQHKTHQSCHPDLLADAIRFANREVYDRSNTSDELDNMGTTIVAALVVDNNCHVAHVGDSRVYLQSESGFRQLTVDHSLVNDLLSHGSITEEEARNFSQKNSITRAVGIEDNVKVDLISFELEYGNKLLLCTDGLTSRVEDEVIEDVLQMAISLEEMTDMLIYLSNASGGYDNITVTIGEYTGGHQ